MKVSRIATSAFVLVALGLAGCSGSESDSKEPKSAGKERVVNPDVVKSLAKLSAPDRESAEKQGTCPVSGEPLGSMDVPVKVAVEGTDVWICCASCEDSLKSDPKKYLDKLK